MAHLHRFHMEEPPASGGTAELSADEAHHALRVVRVRVGDVVGLFDGAGGTWDATVADADKRRVWLHVGSGRVVPAPRPALTLVQAWLHRPQPMEDLVRRGTELGVARFCFYRAGRSQSAPKIPDKWRRLAIEACKQCGNVWLPRFDTASDLGAALGDLGGTILLATADEPPVPLAHAVAGADAVALVVGPEGDFSPEERALALAAGAQPLSLGDTVFRAEAAAEIALGLIRYVTGGLGALPGRLGTS
jgi:16S rRNA (uracil1498-N3)-methyltransferase